jgi:hypothetical protein
VLDALAGAGAALGPFGLPSACWSSASDHGVARAEGGGAGRARPVRPRAGRRSGVWPPRATPSGDELPRPRPDDRSLEGGRGARGAEIPAAGWDCEAGCYGMGSRAGSSARIVVRAGPA